MQDPVPSSKRSGQINAAFDLGSCEPDPEPDSCTAACAEVLDPSRLLSPRLVSWLTTQTLAAMAILGATGEVRARIVNDSEMAAAHQKYSGIAGTTDVLTFDLRDADSESGDPLDVDLWICADEAHRHASERGHSVERELLLYIVHGILHCRGYDDHDETGHRIMHAEEDRILAAIGVGATFGAACAGDATGGTA